MPNFFLRLGPGQYQMALFGVRQRKLLFIIQLKKHFWFKNITFYTFPDEISQIILFKTWIAQNNLAKTDTSCWNTKKDYLKSLEREKRGNKIPFSGYTKIAFKKYQIIWSKKQTWRRKKGFSFKQTSMLKKVVSSLKKIRSN